jgi:hypothetical protein
MKAQTGIEVELYIFSSRGVRWEWVVNAIPPSLYPQEKSGTYSKL